MKFNWLLFIVFTMLIGTSCSITRRVPEGQHLYTSAKYKIKQARKNDRVASLKYDYTNLIKGSPKANKKFLGVRWRLRFYNFFYTKKEKGLKHWFKTHWGEPPVLYDKKKINEVTSVLENKAFNNGFFVAEAVNSAKLKRKKAKVKYLITLDSQTVISQIENNINDTIIRYEINKSWHKTLLKIGNPYNLTTIKEERNRITNLLRNEGYAFFRNDDLLFLADTLKGGHQVKLSIVLKDDVKPVSIQPQTINNVFVYPNAKATSYTAQYDTILYKGLVILQNRTHLSPSTLRHAITIKQGNKYDAKAHQTTLERLSALKNHQFIDVQFQPSPSSDTLLDAVIRLVPKPRQKIDGALGFALKSNLYFGPEGTITYNNYNIFRGAEQLTIQTSGNYYFPWNKRIRSYQEQKVTAQLTKPKLVIPFRLKSEPRLVAKSHVKAFWDIQGYSIPMSPLDSFLIDNDLTSLQEKLAIDSTFAPAFSLNKIEISAYYQWRRWKHISHEFHPVDITLQVPNYEDDELRFVVLSGLNSQNNDNGRRIFAFEKMLVLRSHYKYIYDSRLNKIKRGSFRYAGKFSIVVNRILSENSSIPKAFFNSQFIQLEQDFRYYFKLSKSNTIAYRIAYNVSIPLRKDIVLPFFNLYEVGGANSIRAFNPREVGPGSEVPTTEQLLFLSGKGDILLESSLELRPKINDLLELGLFIDAGNVWLHGSSVDGENNLGVFTFDNFYKQLAIGTGLGLRFNLGMLLLRFDIATPLSKPWLAEGKRWVGNDIDFLNRDWRRENIRYQLNFGYSF